MSPTEWESVIVSVRSLGYDEDYCVYHECNLCALAQKSSRVSMYNIQLFLNASTCLTYYTVYYIASCQCLEIVDTN